MLVLALTNNIYENNLTRVSFLLYPLPLWYNVQLETKWSLVRALLLVGCLLICLFICVYHGSDITTCTISGLQILVKLCNDVVMVSHIIIWQHQSIPVVPHNF